jgi:hypothetical protein
MSNGSHLNIDTYSCRNFFVDEGMIKYERCVAPMQFYTWNVTFMHKLVPNYFGCNFGYGYNGRMVGPVLPADGLHAAPHCLLLITLVQFVAKGLAADGGFEDLGQLRLGSTLAKRYF